MPAHGHHDGTPRGSSASHVEAGQTAGEVPCRARTSSCHDFAAAVTCLSASDAVRSFHASPATNGAVCVPSSDPFPLLALGPLHSGDGSGKERSSQPKHGKRKANSHHHHVHDYNHHRSQSLDLTAGPFTISSGSTSGATFGKVSRTVLVDGFEYSEDDEGNQMGNGCGEALSRNSSEDDEVDELVTDAVRLRGPLLRPRRVITCSTPATKSACAAAVAAVVPAALSVAIPTACSTVGSPHGPRTASTAINAVAIPSVCVVDAALSEVPATANTDRRSSGQSSSNDNSCGGLAGGTAAVKVVADDVSTVLSGLQLMMQDHAEEQQMASACAVPPHTASPTSMPMVGAAINGGKSFLDRFAPLYEIAIFDIIVECERRVICASPVERDRQCERLKGRSNASLAVSAHAFDSPVTPSQRLFPSVAVSPPSHGIRRTPSHQQPSSFSHIYRHNRMASSRFGDDVSAAACNLGCCSGDGSHPDSCTWAQHNSRRSCLVRSNSLSLLCSYASSAAGVPPLAAAQQQQQQLSPSILHSMHGLICSAATSHALPPPSGAAANAHSRARTQTHTRSGSAVCSTASGNAGTLSIRGFAATVASANTMHGESHCLECLPPTESIQRLLRALDAQMRYQESAPLVFTAALAYLARFASGCVSSYASVTSSNWFRMTTIAILIASKMYNDHSTRQLNRLFAEASAVPLRDVCKLELDFLYLLDFNLLLAESDVEEWADWMGRLAARHDMMTPWQTFVADRAPVAGYGSSSACGGGAVAPITAAGDAADTASTTLDTASVLSLASAPMSDVITARCMSAASAVLHEPLPLPLPLHDMTECTKEVREGSVKGNAEDKGNDERLFSVVHAPAEPMTPPTVRELSRLGGTPPSPLAPPALPCTSPVSFFKRGSNVGGGCGSSLVARATASGSSVQSYYSCHHEQQAGRSHQQTTRACAASLSHAPLSAPVAANVPSTSFTVTSTAAATLPTRARGAETSSGGGVLQRVREALNVTASLVRGQLNVMTPTVGDASTCATSPAATGGVVLPSHVITIPTGAGTSAAAAAHSGVSQRVAASVVAPTGSEASFYPITASNDAVVTDAAGTSPWRNGGVAGRHSTGHRGEADEDEVQQAAVAVMDASPEDNENECREEGEGEEEEEEEEGYWDEYRYYHYYDDDEGYYDEDGNYYTYAEDQAAAAASAAVAGGCSRAYAFGADAAVRGDMLTMSEEEGDEGEDEDDALYTDDDVFFRPPPRTHSPPAL